MTSYARSDELTMLIQKCDEDVAWWKHQFEIGNCVKGDYLKQRTRIMCKRAEYVFELRRIEKVRS